VALAALAACGHDPAPMNDPPITVMTFNIRYGTADDGANAWELRRGLLIATIHEAHPDILGLQEALRGQLDELGEAFPEYREVGVGRDDGMEAGEYSAILFRADRFEAEDDGTFWLSDTPETPGSMSWGNRIPRIATWVRLRDRSTDRSFVAYNTHWDHESQPSRERSAALLLRRIAARGADTLPVILTGDFNAGEDNPAFRALVGGSPELRDTFREVHPEADSVGTFNGFTGDRNGDKIDAILVSPAWAVLNSAIDHRGDAGRYPSDHFPVLASLRRRVGR
jgi:endonuclease/exonuclease/phosphatase family metal-dependent hydrolase